MLDNSRALCLKLMCGILRFPTVEQSLFGCQQTVYNDYGLTVYYEHGKLLSVFFIRMAEVS